MLPSQCRDYTDLDPCVNKANALLPTSLEPAGKPYPLINRDQTILDFDCTGRKRKDDVRWYVQNEINQLLFNLQ
jgi:hypothetical protein